MIYDIKILLIKIAWYFFTLKNRICSKSDYQSRRGGLCKLTLNLWGGRWKRKKFRDRSHEIIGLEVIGLDCIQSQIYAIQEYNWHIQHGRAFQNNCNRASYVNYHSKSQINEQNY